MASARPQLTCPICGKGFEFKSALARHTNRSRPCAKISKEYSCEHCGKVFTHRQSLWRHKKMCNTQVLATVTEDLQAKIGRIEKELQEIKSKPRATIVNIQNTLNLNVYGQESLAEICDAPLVKKFLTDFVPNNKNPSDEDLARASEKVYLTLFRHAYANIDHPQNLTCYIESKDSKMAHVHIKAGHWDQIPLCTATQQLSQRMIEHLQKNQPVEPAAAAMVAPLLRKIFEDEKRLPDSPGIPPLLHTNFQRLLDMAPTLP